MENKDMAQYLAMPINTSTITVGYKHEAPNYIKLGAGPVHYGTDMVGYPQAFYASGHGVVLGINQNANQIVGKWVAVKYFDVIGYGDLVVRYFHLDQVYVSVGQTVTLDTKLALYGNTGPYSKGAHLHVEVDTDVVYWNYTPTISGSSGQLRGGTRDGNGTDTSTRNPLDVFRLKRSYPENQTCNMTKDPEFRMRYTAINTF